MAGAEGRPPATPRVAVVIPTFRRPQLLARCLRAIGRQRFPPEQFEVVVVDDGCSEDTRRAVRACALAIGGVPPLRYLRPPVPAGGPATARNLGWQASAAPIIAFTDDDTVPDAHWLREGVAALAGGAMAAAGRVTVPVDGPPTDHARNTQGLASAEFVTANAFVRREALEAVGGFDERFKRAWREDSDLHFALIGRYGEPVRAERAIVEHPVRPAPWGISLRQQANVVFDALLYRKHRRLYRERVRRRPPWSYLVIVGSIVAAVGLALADLPGAALACLGVGSAGIARFAARRLDGTSHAPAHVAEMIVTSAAIPFLSLFWRAVGVARFRVLFP